MDTYLHVKLAVKREHYQEFIHNAKRFLETSFLEKQKGWHFLLGFETLSAKLIDDQTRTLIPIPDNLVYFTNVWKLPPDADVASVMLELSELGEYVELDNLVTTEDQEIVLRVNDPSQDDEELAGELYSGALFAMVRHYPFRDSLASFVFTSAALAPQVEAASGFGYAGCYQNVTGLLNEFWELWRVQTQDIRKPSEALDYAKGALSKAINSLEDTVAKDYKKSIFFETSSLKRDNPAENAKLPPDGPDDGIVLVKAAPYWKPARRSAS